METGSIVFGRSVAVITGDFIGFSGLDLESRRRMPQIMNLCGKSLKDAYNETLYGEIDVFRGDSWQAMIEAPWLVLRAALFIRAFIRAEYAGRKVDTRMAIGIGSIDYVPEGQVSAGDGEAFRLSGRLLEVIARPDQGRMRCSFPGAREDALIDGIVRLTGSICDYWTSRQARAVLGSLQYRTQAEIAESWPQAISRQAVGRLLARAGWPAVAHGLSVFEEYMRGL